MSQKQERRQFGRRQTNIFGWVIVPGRSPLCCRVTNISPRGAHLEMEKPLWLPYQFKLVFANDQSEQLCEIKHLYAGGLGVMFCEQPAAAPPVPPPKLAAGDAATWVGSGRKR